MIKSTIYCTAPIKKIVYFLIFIFSSLAFAHPGIGIVFDGKKYIYYTDLENVLRIDISTGEEKIVVKNRHTHELALDNEGNLYGEHYWYDENSGKFFNYIWKLDMQGNFSKITNDREGENSDFSFVRDAEFNAFSFSKKNSEFTFYKNSRHSRKELFKANFGFDDINWMHINSEEILYFTALDKLYSFKDSLNLVADGLDKTRFPFIFKGKKHRISGVWNDTLNNTYVALSGSRLIKKIDSSGKVSNFRRTPFFWTPLNGIFDNTGNLWVLESNLFNKIRVRQIKTNALVSYNKNRDLTELSIYIALVLILVYSISIKIKKTLWNRRTIKASI